MLERIWIHIQTYTIIALVNSPGFHAMEWFSAHGHHSSRSSIYNGSRSPIEIYSIYEAEISKESSAKSNRTITIEERL